MLQIVLYDEILGLGAVHRGIRAGFHVSHHHGVVESLHHLQLRQKHGIIECGRNLTYAAPQTLHQPAGLVRARAVIAVLRSERHDRITCGKLLPRIENRAVDMVAARGDIGCPAGVRVIIVGGIAAQHILYLLQLFLAPLRFLLLHLQRNGSCPIIPFLGQKPIHLLHGGIYVQRITVMPVHDPELSVHPFQIPALGLLIISGAFLLQNSLDLLHAKGQLNRVDQVLMLQILHDLIALDHIAALTHCKSLRYQLGVGPLQPELPCSHRNRRVPRSHKNDLHILQALHIGPDRRLGLLTG